MATASSTRRREEDVAGGVIEGIKEAGSTAKQAVTDSFESIKGTASEYFEQGKDRARQLSAQMERQVRDQPVKAVLIAAAAGFLVGMLYMRR